MASKEKVCDWQLKCNNINECTGHILDTQQWTDCSFLVGVDGTLVRAHKLILAMVSPVFEAMFYGPLAETEGPISIPDMEPLTFNAMLEYIYTDKVSIKSYKLAIDLVYAAQKYMIPRLVTVCSNYLSKELTPETVCRIYELAILIEDKQLLKGCEKMIMSQSVRVLSSKSFLKLNVDTVVSMYKLPMNLFSEIPLIRAAELYNDTLKARSLDSVTSSEALDDFGLQDLFKSQSNDVQSVGGDRQILKVLQQIRFLSLTPQQLGVEKSICSLLTPDEIAAIMVNAAVTVGNASMPMPEGFSTCRRIRREVTSDQLNYLRNYMKHNPDLNDSSEEEVEETHNMWRKLKSKLNKRGPPRSTDEWQYLWMDHQNKRKKRSHH